MTDVCIRAFVFASDPHDRARNFSSNRATTTCCLGLLLASFRVSKLNRVRVRLRFSLGPAEISLKCRVKVSLTSLKAGVGTFSGDEAGFASALSQIGSIGSCHANFQ